MSTAIPGQSRTGILFFHHPRHGYTVKQWLNRHPESLRGQWSLLDYDQLAGQGADPLFEQHQQAHCCIFADLDRLPRGARSAAIRFCQLAADAGMRVLNNPAQSLLRFDLQQQLRNRFRVFRLNRLPRRLRFPVFLRAEHGHSGSLTPLIHNQQTLERYRRAHPRALLLEFLDTSDDLLVFRKYSVMRIGDHLVPRHLLFGHSWLLKEPELISDDYVREEMAFLEQFPYRDAVRDAFERGHIEYGRIDFSVYRGEIQVWEINTNPMLKLNDRLPERRRTAVFEHSAVGINRAFLSLCQ